MQLLNISKAFFLLLPFYYIIALPIILPMMCNRPRQQHNDAGQLRNGGNVAEWHSAHHSNSAHNLSGNRSSLFHQCRWRDHRSERGNVRDHHLRKLRMDKCSVLRSQLQRSRHTALRNSTEQNGGYVHFPGTDRKPVLSLRRKLRSITWQTKL